MENSATSETPLNPSLFNFTHLQTNKTIPSGLSAQEEEEKRSQDWEFIMARSQHGKLSVGKKRPWNTMGEAAREPSTDEDCNANGSAG